MGHKVLHPWYDFPRHEARNEVGPKLLQQGAYEVPKLSGPIVGDMGFVRVLCVSKNLEQREQQVSNWFFVFGGRGHVFFVCFL